MNIVDRILQVRETNNISQAEFARLLDITPQSLVRYEKSNVKPSVELLKKICDKIDNLNGHWLLTGNGNMYLSNNSIKGSFNIVDFLFKDSPNKDIEAINVTGDSMEPTFNSGDVIFVDKSQIVILNDGIYAFENENGLFVKRIQKRIDGALNIISDNKEYPVQITKDNEINIVGKIVSVVRNTIL
jgi:transcriptional regulator with XRE-family HTH domain